MQSNHIDKLALIEIKDNKILMTLTKGNDTWYIPGGKREMGETDEQALQREILEELGVLIDVSSMRLYGVFQAQAHGKQEGVMVHMKCYTARYKGDPRPCAEIESLEYFDFSQRHRSSSVDNLIFQDLYQKKLIV